MKIFAALGLGVLSACGVSREEPSVLQYDSFHSVGLDGLIDSGTLLTTSQDPVQIHSMIREQLLYSVGFLNGWGGVANLAMAQSSIKLVGSEERSPGLFAVTYQAALTVSWPRNVPFPAELALVLPESMDASRNMPEEYFKLYATKNCLDPSTHDLSLGSFWYYIRPLQPQCPLASYPTAAPLAVHVPMRLSYSEVNTSGRRPEYQKIWEDGRLDVTAIFSKNQANGNDGDIGVIQYRQFFFGLLKAFGRPVRLDQYIPRRGPGTETPKINMEFRSVRGPVVVHMRLVAGMYGNGSEFEKEFASLSSQSDVVMYHGHAGLGANVQGLMDLSTAIPNKYQLYVINGCDTFAYLDETLARKHQLANPEATPYKFVDVITNSMPSAFADNAMTASRVIDTMVHANLTYRQLLSMFGPRQYAAVIGEEDNL